MISFQFIIIENVLVQPFSIDVESNRKMLKMLMRQRSIHAELSENGRDAVDIVMRDMNKFHMIFMDNQMPVLVSSITFATIELSKR